MRLRFGEFVLDTAERVLLRGEAELTLEPKVFDCIALLASEASKLTSTERLRSALWPGVHVGDGALRRIINEARKALGDNGNDQSFIRTRKGLGYVFVPPVVEESRSGEGSPPWPFVGRERELGVLRDWLAKGEAGGLCFVSGEAGAGKSSTIERLAAASSNHGRWLFGHCQATLGLPAFWPFREVATQMTREPFLRSRALALAAKAPGVMQLMPELADAKYAASTPAVADAATRFELCESFAELLRELSRACPLWLAIEDVHWADHGSLALLEAVARAAHGRPLYVLATYRPEAVAAGSALGQLIGRVSGRSGGFSMHLEPLGVEDLRVLLGQARLPGSSLHAASSLLRLTGGNALYVHELVRHLLATGAALESALPPSLSHIIAERVSALPEVTQNRLGQAAILGDDFGLVQIAALAATSRVAIEAELEPALRSGLLRQSRLHPEHMQFCHALVRDALVRRLLPHQKQDYHRAAFAAVRATSAGDASCAELAVHAFEAGEHVPAETRRRLYEQAGREALAALAFDGAALHLGRALQLSAADDASFSAAELALLCARARFHADEPERAVEEAFLDAAERARRAGAHVLLAEAALGYAAADESCLTLRIASLRPEALDLVREAWQRLESDAEGGAESCPGHVAYRLAAALCWLQAEAGELAQLRLSAQRAIRLAPEDLEPIQQLWLLGLRSIAEPERALPLADEILTRVRASRLEPRRRIEVLFIAMATYLGSGELARYQEAANEVARLGGLLPRRALGGRLGERLSMYLTLPLCVPVTLAVMQGRLADAERLFWHVAEQVRKLGFSPTRESEHDGLHILLQLYGYLGRSSQLEPLVDSYVTTTPKAHWFGALMKTHFALERGDRSQAAAHFALLRQSGLEPTLGERTLAPKPETLVRLADACVEVGLPADASTLYDALLPRADRVIQDGLLICWGSCARPLGALAHQLQRYGDAERHYREAIAINQRLGHRPELVRTQLGLARLMRATGRLSEARALRSALQREAGEIGMAPTVQQASALGD